MRRAIPLAKWVIAAASLASCAASNAPLIDAGTSDGGGVQDGGPDSGIVDAGNGDPNCSVANCKALVQCGFALQGQPVNLLCMILALDGGYAALLAINTRYCVEACAADDAGPVVACVASFQGACADAGAMARQVAEGILAACTPPYVDAGPVFQACIDACTSTVDSCSNSCLSTTNQDACFSCDYECSQAFVSCTNACM